ncbi:dolichol kinase, partial [Halolamina salina]
ADGVKPVVAGYVVDDNATIPPAAAIGITLVFVAVGPGLSAALGL